MDADMQSQTNRLESAGRLALRRVPIVPAGATVGEVRDQIRTTNFETADLILLTDPAGRYLTAVELRSLVENGDATTLHDLARTDWPCVPSATDQEEAAAVAIRNNVTVLPVTDGEGRPIGVLSARTLIDILGHEHREDVHRIAGILREREGARHALEDPPLRRVALRLPWLLTGLALSSAATGVMASFEAALQSNVMIAFFIPAIVYLADAVGTQTEAIAVRGLPTRDRPLVVLLWSEVLTGGTIGLVLGVLAFAAVWLAFGNLAVAIGVGVSLLAAGTLASGIGLLFPWVLSKIGLDPAFGAGPVATIVQDVLTIVIYFLVMTRLVGLTG